MGVLDNLGFLKSWKAKNWKVLVLFPFVHYDFLYRVPVK